MAKQKFTVFVHQNLESHPYCPGKRWLAETDLSGPGTYSGEHAVMIQECEIEIDIPEVDTRQQAIDKLERQVEQERADSQVRVNLLLDRISKLKAIAHEVTGYE